MKLEVGMYVRTKKGIAKVTNIDDLDNVAWTDKKGIYFGVKRDNISLDWNVYDDGTVVKVGHNIIDLIEQKYLILDKTGRIYEVIRIESSMLLSNPPQEKKYIVTEDYYNIYEIYEKDIKSILTHEQFEDNCYMLENRY